MLLILGVPFRAVVGWSSVAPRTRYQHTTPELTTSIANQMGGFCGPTWRTLTAKTATTRPFQRPPSGTTETGTETDDKNAG
jgi:hypothetical protein